MKKLTCLLLAMALPVAVPAQDAKKAAATKPVVLSTYRIVPKPGHEKQLEAALAAHAKKFHQGDHAWRVGEVKSGPDAGMYHITEGPTSWTAFDTRGDLGAEHMKDYQANVQPHVEKNMPDVLLTYQTSLSTTDATKWTDKVGVSHLVTKPGRGTHAADTLKKWKAIYEKLGLTVAVWRTSWSGENTYVLVFRLKNGFRQFEEPTPEFRKTADELFGAGEYDRLQQAAADDYSKMWSELIEFKPELGSPAGKARTTTNAQ
jgi:hypothetical protein